MASLTLRNIPPELHARLKRAATTNGRSLNQEALFRLGGGGRSAEEVAAILARADALRDESRRLGVRVTSGEVTRLKRQSRR